MYGVNRPAKANIPFSIALNGTVSTAIPTQDTTFCGWQMPVAWDAGNVTFQGSIDGGVTYGAVYYEGIQYTVTTPAAGTYQAVNPTVFCGFTHVKLVSGVAQTAARSMSASTRIL